MVTLTFLLAAFLDPVQAGIVLAAIVFHRGPLPIIVAGVIAAVVSETIMVLAVDDYMWGELIVPRVISSLMQAAVLWWIVRVIRQSLARGSVARADVGPAPGSATARVGSFATGGSLPGSQLAPWHMRAYVRRRMNRLRLR